MPGQTSTVKKAARGKQRPAKTPTAEDGPRPGTAPRTVRPRQLHVNDKMRVIVGTNDPDIAGIDGGAFLEYLQRQEEEAQQGANSVRLSALQPRVAVIGHTFKPIPASLEAPELSVVGKPPPAVRQEAANAIATPSYTNIQSNLVQENATGGKSAYIRYVVPTPDDEEATVEYDLDEEDEEWLQHHCQGKQKMSEDEMEQLMDALEKMHHTELQKHPERWANLIGSPLPAKDGKGKGKASSDGLQLPDVDTVLPLQKALQGLSSQPAAAVKAVYLHWCQKRQYSERPLLQRLWYEPPWHRLTVAGSKGKAKTEGESEDDVPFMAQEERRPLNRARKTMQLQDVDSKLRDMRDDLEQVRILADQCRRREKLRKRALASWQQNMHVLLQQAVSLDQQLLASSSPSTSAKQVSPSKSAKPLFGKAQSGKKHSHSKGTGSKQAKQLAAEIADASENAQAKLAHDMALSLQLTRGVADEAAKLHHVKIIRAHSGQPRSSNGAVGPSDEAGPSGQGHSLTQQQPSPVTGAHDIAAEACEDPTPSDPETHPSRTSPQRLTRSMQAEGLLSVPSPSIASSSCVTLKSADADTHSGIIPCRVTRSAQSRGTDGNAAPSSHSQAQPVREVHSERSQQAAISRSPVLQRVTRSGQGQIGISIDYPPEAAGLTPAGPSDNGTFPVSPSPSFLSLPRITRSGKSCVSQGPVSSANQHLVSSASASPQIRHPVSLGDHPPISQLRVSPRLAPEGVPVTPVLAGSSVKEGQAGTSPRQTRSQRAVASKAQPSSSAQEDAEEAGNDSRPAAPKAEEAPVSSPVITSAAKAPQGLRASQHSSQKKTVRAASTGKAVRFSDSSPESSRKDKPTSARKQPDRVVSASDPSTAKADAPNPCSSQDGAVNVSLTRSTRSGQLLGVIPSESVIPLAAPESTHAHPASHIPQALSEAQCKSGDEASNNTRTTRSGRLFAAKTDPPFPPNSVSHSAHESADTAAASEPGAVQPESTSAETQTIPSTASVATDAAPSEAPRAAAAGVSLSQPWEQPLLGAGLSLGLPEEARWADQGRPSTDHPRHKTKSASMMRRTLSPPLSSPRSLPPQPLQSPRSKHPQDPSGPSQFCAQFPSQLPASQSQSIRVTVDRGCDPIVFSDDSGSDRESEEAGGAAAGKKCRRLVARQEPARKAQKRALSETPSEVTRRVTRHAANESADHVHASITSVDSTRPTTRAVDTTRPSTRGPLASAHASPIAHTHTPSMADASTSAAGDVLSADRPLTRALRAAGVVTTPAAAAASKAAIGAATISASKPPLPPTAAKALTAHKAAQKRISAGPVAAPKGGSGHIPLPRGESTTPHTATAKKQSSARPARSAAAAEAADAAAVLAVGVDPDWPMTRRSAVGVDPDRPMTRRSAVGVDPDRPMTRQSAAQQVTTPSTAAADASAAAADEASLPRTCNRRRNSCKSLLSYSAQDEGRLQAMPSGEAAARAQVPPAKRNRGHDEVAPMLLAAPGPECAAPSGQAAGNAVPAGSPKQQGATTTASSARYAANRIAKSLVTNARSASRQGRAAFAPAKKPSLPTHPPGPAARPQLHAVPPPSNGGPSVTAASPAAAAAALEEAAASGKVGCPKCRYAKYGCKKCRNAYVMKTGVLIPVDRSVQAAAFALLQPASGSGQQGPNPGQPVTKVSQPPSASAAAGQVTGTGINRSGTVQSATQPKSAKRQSSSSEIEQQQAAKKQKRAPDQPMAKQAASSQQASGGRVSVAGVAQSGRPAAAALPASSPAPGSKLAGSVKKSGTAAQPHASEASARLAKRARTASSPAPPQGSTDPGASAAKRSRLSESVTAADAAAVATAPSTVQAKPSRASQRSAADAAASRSDKGKAKAAGVGNTSTAAPHRSKPSSVSKLAAAVATEAQKHKRSRSGAPQPSRSSGAVRRPVRLAPAGPDPGSSKQQNVKGSTAAALSTGPPGIAVSAPRPAAGRQKSVAKAVKLQQDAAPGSAVARPKLAAAKGPTATAPKQATGRGPPPAAPKSAMGAQSRSSLPKQASDAATVPAKARTKSVASPKVMTAAKLKCTVSGKAATAAGHAVATALDSNLGCSKLVLLGFVLRVDKCLLYFMH
ncbi:hypothetical protein WJX77_000497 [Trebouxia sp. C0004]